MQAVLTICSQFGFYAYNTNQTIVDMKNQQVSGGLLAGTLNLNSLSVYQYM